MRKHKEKKLAAHKSKTFKEIQTLLKYVLL